MGFDVMDVFVKVGADISGLESGINKSEGLVSKLGSGFGSAMKVAGAAVAGATAAVGTFAASSVKVGKAFDLSMAQVAATMGVTVDEIGELREFAQEMGATTAFSASQAADALNYMALAGYDAEQSMSMLPNVLNLAAAGDMELARASDMVTDAASALGFTLEDGSVDIKQTSELVDQLAKTASKSNTSVSQLGEAILTIGGTAKILSGGTTELNTALGILADNGIKGSEGGTKLRNVLLSLSAPTDKASAMLEQLGVQAVDTATGDLRPLEEIMGDLSSSLDGLGTAERAEIINTIFNKQDIAAVNALLDTNAERWDELSMEIDGAWLVMDNFKEALSDTGISFDAMDKSLQKIGISTEDFEEALKYSKGDAEAFADIIGEWSDEGTNFNDVLNDMGISLDDVQTAMDATAGAAQQMADTQLNNLEGDITKFRSALEGAQIQISDALTPSLREFVSFGTDGISKIATAFKEGGLSGAMDAFGTVLSDGLDMIISKLPSFIDAGMKLLGALGQGILDNLPTIVNAAVQIGVQFLGGLIQALPAFAEGGMTLIKELVNSIKQNAPQLLASGKELLTTIMNGLKEGFPNAIAYLAELFTEIVSYFKEHAAEIQKTGAEITQAIVNGIVDSIPTLISGLADLVVSAALAITDPATLTPLVESGLDMILALVDGLLEALPKLIEAAPVIIENLVTAIVANLPTIIDAGIKLIGALLKALLENMPLLLAAGVQIINALIRGIIESIPSVLVSGMKLTGELIATIISAAPRFLENGAKLIGAFVSGLVKTIGSVVRAALDMIRQFIGAITGSYSSIIQAGVDVINSFKNGINQKIQDAKNWGKDLINNFIGGIKEKWDALKDTVSDIAGSIKDLLGFSEPKLGPLSNFHTYAPDMMKLFAQGIIDNEDMLRSVVASAFDFTDLINNNNQFESAYAGGYGGYSQTVNIYSPTALTPSEVARQTRNATRDMVLELRGKR